MMHRPMSRLCKSCGVSVRTRTGVPRCKECSRTRRREKARLTDRSTYARAAVRAKHAKARAKARGHAWSPGQTARAVSMLENASVCECCGRSPPRLVIDHNHETGLIRGMLCTLCNTMLGKAGDTQARLALGILYLERHK